MVRLSDGETWYSSPNQPVPSSSIYSARRLYNLNPPRTKRPAPTRPTYPPKEIQEVQEEMKRPEEQNQVQDFSSESTLSSSSSEIDNLVQANSQAATTEEPTPIPKPDYPTQESEKPIPAPDYDQGKIPFEQKSPEPSPQPLIVAAPVVVTPAVKQQPFDEDSVNPAKKRSNLDKLKAKLRTPKPSKTNPEPNMEQSPAEPCSNQPMVIVVYPGGNQTTYTPADMARVAPPAEEKKDPEPEPEPAPPPSPPPPVAEPEPPAAPVVYNPQPYSQPAQEALARETPPPEAPVVAAVTVANAEPEPVPSTSQDLGSSTQHHPGGPPVGIPERPDTPLSFTSSTLGMGTIGPVGFDVAYVDFIPQCTEPAENIGDAKYETLKTLMVRANEWLSMSLTMKPISFESINIPCDSRGEVDPDKVLHEVEGLETWYIRVLRMWVTCKKPEDDPRPIEVRHINLYPKWSPTTTRTGRPGMPNSEQLDETILRVNEDFSTGYPLSGRVLSMETVGNLPAYHKEGTPIHLDPDMNIWRDTRRHDINFLTIIRLFYIPGEPNHEILGVQDFVPELKKPGDPESLEPFEDLVKAANHWAKKYKGLRVTNLQTVKLLIGDNSFAGDYVNTRETLIRRRSKADAHYLNFLRVYYTQKVDNTPLGPEVEPPSAIHYKNFVPIIRVGSDGKLNVKKVQTMRKAAQKMVAWVCLSGQEVICVETIALCGKGKLNFDPENNHSFDAGGQGTGHILFGFRAYTDYSLDDNKSETLSLAGSLRGSHSGSVASRDYSAWPEREIPKNYLKQ